ncbi:MAG: zinc-dependent alcohol dehydrogenase family protein [Pseudomonadota bacterium]
MIGNANAGKTSLKQAIYRTHGTPADVIEVVERETQPLQVGQTRVKILRTPINPSDMFQVAGQYGIQPPLPAVGGMEGVGEVVEVSGDGLPVGSKVLLADPPGAWATERVFRSDVLVPIPKADFDQLAMLTVNPATAFLLLTKYVDVKEGDWIIISAANSATARYITQLAKARNIKVASVVRRASAIDAVRDAGADAAFVDGPDLLDEVTAELDKAPVLALDAVAGETTGRLAATLRNGGTIVIYGGESAQPSVLSDASIIFKDVRVRGFWLVNWLTRASQQERVETYQALTQLILEQKLNAPIDRIFPLEEINEALAYTAKGGLNGKVLIAPNGV